MNKDQDLHINTSQMVVFSLKSKSDEIYQRIMSGEKWLIIPTEIMTGIYMVQGTHALALSSIDGTECAALIVKAFWCKLHDLVEEPAWGLGVSAEVFREGWDRDHPPGDPLTWGQAPTVLCFEVAVDEDGQPYHLSYADPGLADEILTHMRQQRASETGNVATADLQPREPR